MNGENQNAENSQSASIGFLIFYEMDLSELIDTDAPIKGGIHIDLTHASDNG